MSIVLATLGGAGLVAVNVKPDFAAQHGGALVGSLISLVFSILVQLSSEFGVDRKATQARSASDSFRLIRANLDIVLCNANPTDMIIKLLEETKDPWLKYNDVIPDRSAHIAEAQKLALDLVVQFSGHWILPAARRRPRAGVTGPPAVAGTGHGLVKSASPLASVPPVANPGELLESPPTDSTPTPTPPRSEAGLGLPGGEFEASSDRGGTES